MNENGMAHDPTEERSEVVEEPVSTMKEMSPQERYMKLVSHIAVRNGWSTRKAKRYIAASQRKEIKNFFKAARAKAKRGEVNMVGVNESVEENNGSEENTPVTVES